MDEIAVAPDEPVVVLDELVAIMEEMVVDLVMVIGRNSGCTG